MIFPTIHLNGTSPESLRDQYLEAASAIRDAMNKAQSVEFNGRDYYPQGPEVFSRARTEFTSRIIALRDAMDYFMKVAEHCAEAADEREARRKKTAYRFAPAPEQGAQ